MELVNVKEAAKSLNVHQRTIYNMINSGRLKAEKPEGREWEISNEQLNEVLSKSLSYNQKAEDLATAVYSLESSNKDIAANTLMLLVEQCNQVSREYAKGTRGTEMDRAIVRLEERISRVKASQNVTEFMGLVLQKANYFIDAALNDIEQQIDLMEVK